MARAVRATVPTTVGKMPPALPMSAGIGGQELEAQDGQAAAQDEGDDEEQHADRDQGQGPQNDPGGLLLDAGAQALHGCFLRLAEVALAMVLRTMMMTNSTTPVAKRASRCSPVA